MGDPSKVDDIHITSLATKADLNMVSLVAYSTGNQMNSLLYLPIYICTVPCLSYLGPVYFVQTD